LNCGGGAKKIPYISPGSGADLRVQADCNLNPAEYQITDFPYTGFLCENLATSLGIHSNLTQAACTALHGTFLSSKQCQIVIPIYDLTTRKYLLCRSKGRSSGFISLTIEQLSIPWALLSGPLFMYRWTLIGREDCKHHSPHDITTEITYSFNTDGYDAKESLTKLHAQTWAYIRNELSKTGFKCFSAQNDREE
jgi:hypothetical protein